MSRLFSLILLVLFFSNAVHATSTPCCPHRFLWPNIVSIDAENRHIYTGDGAAWSYSPDVNVQSAGSEENYPYRPQFRFETPDDLPQEWMCGHVISYAIHPNTGEVMLCNVMEAIERKNNSDTNAFLKPSPLPLQLISYPPILIDKIDPERKNLYVTVDILFKRYHKTMQDIFTVAHVPESWLKGDPILISYSWNAESRHIINLRLNEQLEGNWQVPCPHFKAKHNAPQ